MQDLIATKLGIQRITGITVFDTREKKSYNPLPDLEVGRLYFCYFSRQFGARMHAIVTKSHFGQG